MTAKIGDTNYGVARVTVGWSSNISGTDGDKYKTHCDAYAVHANTITWEIESGTITL